MNLKAQLNLSELLGITDIEGLMPAKLITLITINIPTDIIYDQNNNVVTDVIELYDDDGILDNNYKKGKLTISDPELIMEHISTIYIKDKEISINQYLKDYNKILFGQLNGVPYYNFIADVNKEIAICENFLNYVKANIDQHNINVKNDHYNTKRIDKMPTSVFLDGHFRSLVTNNSNRDHVKTVINKYFPDYELPDIDNDNISDKDINTITFLSLIGNMYDSIENHLTMLKKIQILVQENPAYISREFFPYNYVDKRKNFVVDINNEEYNNLQFYKMEVFKEIYYIKSMNYAGFVSENKKYYESKYLILVKSINGDKWNILLYGDKEKEIANLNKVMLTKLDKIKKNASVNVKHEL